MIRVFKTGSTAETFSHEASLTLAGEEMSARV
jgi:hypothetical protein